MGVIKDTKSDRIFSIVNYFVLTILLIITAYPLLFIVSASISDPTLVATGKMLLIPKGISFDGFQAVFKDSRVLTGYKNTIIYTVVGTLISLGVTLPAAYSLSRKDFVGRNVFTTIFMVTMFFSGGLIPTYLLIKSLHMRDTMWALVLPAATSMWYIVICRTFFQTNIPDELVEAAEIDGCSDLRLFFSVVLRLSAPIIAVMSLFFGIEQWSSFFTALIYLTRKSLYPLQLILREILIQSEFDAQQILLSGNDTAEVLEKNLRTSEQLKYALIIVSSLPLLMAYPSIQKYFVKGVMVGAIKG